MDQIFPFNLPAPTAWYAVLYVVTLLLHIVFMSYVLAGSIMLGIAGFRGMLGISGRPSVWSAVTTILKDWMPFALSAAITAGVAPLLFVQILYQQEFYTANLLSFHRWMAILPVLIVAFYLLYLLKANRIEGRTALQGIVAMLVMACILFVGWSWVENHLLSLNRAAWPTQYETQAMVYKVPAILPRLGFWIASAFPTGCVLLAWQVRAGASHVDAPSALKALRPLAVLAVVTMLVAALLAWPVLSRPAGDESSVTLRAVSGWIYVGAAGAGLAVIGWVAVACRARPLGGMLAAASLGTLAFWAGSLVARESARLSIVGSEALLARHERVGTIAGFGVFLVFALFGLAVIGWVIRSVANARRGMSSVGQPDDHAALQVTRQPRSRMSSTPM